MVQADLLPYLYFVFSRRDTEMLARGLGGQIRRSLLDREETHRSEARLDQAAADLGTVLDDELRELYANGIAFHHAGLHVQLKALVEELYEAKLIKVLYCTSTFALGINMPARSVVFDGLKKYDGRSFAPLTTRQFMQKAGRAGRRGMDDVGHVVIRLDLEEFDEAKSQLERYAQGTPEPVRSSFSLSWNSIINLLERHEGDFDRLRDIVDKSFLSWHLDQRAEQHEARAEELDGAAKWARKEVSRLRARAEKARSRVTSRLQTRIDYLVDIGYLGQDMSLQAGAKVLRHLQISEIFVTELVLSGLLEDLDPPRLFGVLCGVTNELPRRARASFRPSGDDKALSRKIKQIRYSDVVVGADELAGTQETSWDPELLHLGRLWAEGHTLEAILEQVHSETDIAGDMISGFRRAKDLAGQLRDVYADLPERAEQIRALVKSVGRDEVEVVG
jgi:superfamily II RNA helicase